MTKVQYRDLDYMDELAEILRQELGLPRHRATRKVAEWRRSRRAALYEELERIDGVRWDGRARERARDEKGSSPAAPQITDGGWDVVPVEAYGLG